MSGISGVGSSGNIPNFPTEQVEQTDPNETDAINYFHDSFADQITAIGKESTALGRK